MNIGVLGHYQNGKSTLINCLMGRMVCAMGDGVISTTKKISRHEFRNGLYLIDTPGMDANEQDNTETSSVIEQLDFAIIVLQNKGVSEKDMVAINLLQQYGVPMIILVNCIDYGNKNKWSPQSEFNKNILSSIKPQFIGKQLVAGIDILLVNLQWYWYSIEGYRQESKEKQEELLERIECILGGNVDINSLKEQSNVPQLIRFLSSDNSFAFIRIYQQLNFNLKKEMETMVELLNII